MYSFNLLRSTQILTLPLLFGVITMGGHQSVGWSTLDMTLIYYFTLVVITAEAVKSAYQLQKFSWLSSWQRSLQIFYYVDLLLSNLIVHLQLCHASS